MSTEIRKLDSPADGRVGTGPIQFGDDWPGFFLRGDSAFAVFLQLRNFTLDPTNIMNQLSMESFAKALLTCNTNKELVKQMETIYGLVAEPADAADLKPADESRGGSIPSRPTTTFKEWQDYMPETEKEISVGQKRIAFVDGVGAFDIDVSRYTDTGCWGKGEKGFEYELDWDSIGIIADGVEHKRILAVEANEDAQG